MTKEQEIFCDGKKELDRLGKIGMVRNLTAEERAEVDNIKMKLWKEIEKYGMQFMHACRTNFEMSEDIKNDLLQEMSVIFLEKLSYYDPEKSAPTTYFKTRFIEVIRKYFCENVTHLSQYDARNARKIKSAVNYFDEKGIKYTVEMLADQTGLSTKVVKTVLDLVNRVNYTSVDENETLRLQTEVGVPEKHMEREEISKILYSVMNETVPPDDLKIFLARVNPEGEKGVSYKVLSEKFGISVHEARRRVCRVKNCLSKNETLCQIYYAVGNS